MAKPNRKCLACHMEYYFCLKCGQNHNVPAWHIDFCDETCKTVFETVCSYNCGSLTKEEANEMIGEIDSDKFNSLKDSLKDKLKEIQPNRKTKSSFVEKKKEEEPQEESKADCSTGLMSPTADEQDEN